MLCSAFGRLSTPVAPWILWWGNEHEGSYAVRQTTLTIHHLYADMMNLYGDRGNVISIKKRCEWRGIPVDVVDVGLGERVRPTGCDLHTEPRKPDEARLIGNVLVEVPAPESREAHSVVGFENHGGRIYLDDCEPLGRVVAGFGNNGKDGTEGARRLNAYGTYLHGSLLPKNPWLTDQLILNALRRVDDTFELEPLDDAVELSAFASVAEQISGRD